MAWMPRRSWTSFARGNTGNDVGIINICHPDNCMLTLWDRVETWQTDITTESPTVFGLFRRLQVLRTSCHQEGYLVLDHKVREQTVSHSPGAWNFKSKPQKKNLGGWVAVKVPIHRSPELHGGPGLATGQFVSFFSASELWEAFLACPTSLPNLAL